MRDMIDYFDVIFKGKEYIPEVDSSKQKVGVVIFGKNTESTLKVLESKNSE